MASCGGEAAWDRNALQPPPPTPAPAPAPMPTPAQRRRRLQRLRRLPVPCSPVRSPEVLFNCTFLNSPADCGFDEQAKVGQRAISRAHRPRRADCSALHTEPGDSDVFGSRYASATISPCRRRPPTATRARAVVGAFDPVPDDYVVPPAGGWGVVMDFHHTGSSGQANFHIDAMPPPDRLRLRGYGGATVASGEYQVTLGQW